MYFNHAFRKTLLGTTTAIASQTSVATSAATSVLQTSGIGNGLYKNTITTGTHSLVAGQTVVIAGITPTAYNGTFIVASVPSSTQIVVYSTVSGGTYSVNGTVVGSASTAINATTSLATSALTAGQLGIYNQNFGVIDYTAAADKTPFYLVQGSYYKTSGYSDKIGSHGGYQESVKSKMINPKYISRILWVQSKLPVQQVVQIPLKDAAGGLANVGLNADTTYRLRIDVKGSPALRFLSHNIYRVMDSYTGPVNATTPSLLKDPVATLVDWKEQLTMSPYFNQLVQARVYAFKNNATNTHFSAGTPTTTSTTLTITSSNTGLILLGQRIVGSTGATSVPANTFATAYGTAFGTGTTPTTAPTASTTSVTITGTGTGTPTGTITVGMYVTGAGLPVNAYVSTVTNQTNYVITYPTQSTAPTITGAAAALTFYDKVVLTYPTQATAPASFSSTFTLKCYSDLYGNNGGYVTPYTNIAVTSGQQPTYVGQTPYIPGSSDYTTGTSQTAGTLTGATITAASTVAAATSGAHIYTASSDTTAFTTDAFLELTAAYLETKFGNPTFTISDNYDLEPLKIIASLMDDSGSTTVVAPIGTAALQTIGEAGIATVAQASSMAQGTGETVLRELILTGRYRQEAFGDGTNIDQFRMREAEANPGVLSMMSVANRNSLYNKLCILHSVPRFNNPTGVFDNDQYLIEIAIPSSVSVSQLFNTQTYVPGNTITTSGLGLGDYILEASIAAGGVQYAEMI